MAKVPQLPDNEIIKVLNAKYPDWKSRPCVLIGVRGYFLKSMGDPTRNDRGIYDDAAFSVGGDQEFGRYAFNTDPSAFKKGRAVLKGGIWHFIPGVHFSPSGHNYPAFRQFGPFTVVRDQQGEETGMFGINLHKGGVNSTSSLGCQTLPADTWVRFRNDLMARIGVTLSEMNGHDHGVPGKEFPYILLERPELEEIIGHPL